MDIERASYYRIHQIHKDNTWKLFIYDREGNEIRSEELIGEPLIKLSGIFDSYNKPRPIKAIISPHHQLGRALGFFDKNNNLVGNWRSYDGE